MFDHWDLIIGHCSYMVIGAWLLGIIFIWLLKFDHWDLYFILLLVIIFTLTYSTIHTKALLTIVEI